MSWYANRGKDGDVVVSTRVRLARNLKDFAFASKINAEQRLKINEIVKNAVEDSDSEVAKNLKYISMDTVPENERYSMVERHIISREFAENYKSRAILISPDETVCVMLGEEDHIRIQVINAGFSLEETFKTANAVDDMLLGALNIAFDEKLGFLTECMTNLGTGMRASVMLHLPALEFAGDLKNLSSSVTKLGFTVRGLYGEGSDATASLYQISNQITLGVSEENALENLNIITQQLLKSEREKREQFDKIYVEDISMRSLATLKSARIMTSKEMMQLISRVNLGLGLNVIKEDILPFKLFIETQPSMLMRTFGNMPPVDRDIKRAEYIRKYLERSNV